MNDQSIFQEAVHRVLFFSAIWLVIVIGLAMVERYFVNRLPGVEE